MISGGTPFISYIPILPDEWSVDVRRQFCQSEIALVVNTDDVGKGYAVQLRKMAPAASKCASEFATANWVHPVLSSVLFYSVWFKSGPAAKGSNSELQHD